jgi:SAM-dependent methyltransferase
MKISAERYFPRIDNPVLIPFEPFLSYEHWHRYRYAVPFVAGKTVLDIASGEGYGSAFLADHADQVYGVDVSEETVQHARQAYVRNNLRFVQGSADDIPISGEHRFDVIVSFETIEHLDAPAQERFAREVKRLLRPDGVLLISTPNRATYAGAGEHKNPYHLHEFTRDEFVRFLRQHFEHVQMLSQHVYPISYIWNIDGPSGPMVEYQMTFDDGAFHPRDGDCKETGYLIAVCADRRELARGNDSLLVDLAEIAFRGIPGRDRWQMTSLFLDTGAGFRAEEVIREQVEYGPEFTVTFAGGSPEPVRELRWDPLELRLCQVRLREVLWQDHRGETHRLDLDRVTSNGLRRDGACVRFETLDPMIYLPISGSVASVTIRGECMIESQADSLIGLEMATRSREQQLAHLGNELQLARERLRFAEERTSAQERSLQEYRDLKGRLDRDLQSARAGLDSARERIWTQEQEYRDQEARADHNLQCTREHLNSVLEHLYLARERISAQERSLEAFRQQVQANTEHLQDRGRGLEECERRASELEETRARLEHSLHLIQSSKRWKYVNKIRSAIYYIPGLLSSSMLSLKGRLG